MSQPESTAHDVLPEWVDSSLIKGMLRGIERESLRMQSNGFLSQEPHPHALGSALTHPHITTDYSEALMEFITPPKESITEALHYLTDIHAFVHRHLKNDEKLWPMSMPCMLDSKDENIPLAQYGSSNIGLFKTLYRHGLGVRYGRRMQTISGVHYNLSFPDHFFIALQEQETDEELRALSLQDYRSHRYMGLIRNFIRLTPLVIFLVGASPAVCQCFMTGRDHHLFPLVRGTLKRLKHRTNSLPVWVWMMPMVSQFRSMTMCYRLKMNTTVWCVQSRYLKKVKLHRKPCKIAGLAMSSCVLSMSIRIARSGSMKILPASWK